MNRFLHFTLSATIALGLTGCATSHSTTMDTGERISQRGGEISNYGEAWSAGQDDVKRGQRLVEKSNHDADKARKQLADAQADVAKAELRIRATQETRLNGEQMVSDGTARMQHAEADYARVRARPAVNSDTPGY